jgi:hypothetical protein
MRRIATISALAALLSGLPLIEASAGEGYRYNGRRAPYFYAPPPPSFSFFGAPFALYGPPAPYNSYARWLGYYNAQADVSFARRNFRANHVVGRGYNPPQARYIGPPTNYYAERYALEPYSYFDCPLARRGEGVCANQPPLSAVPQP